MRLSTHIDPLKPISASPQYLVILNIPVPRIFHLKPKRSRCVCIHLSRLTLRSLFLERMVPPSYNQSSSDSIRIYTSLIFMLGLLNDVLQQPVIIRNPTQPNSSYSSFISIRDFVHRHSYTRFVPPSQLSVIMYHPLLFCLCVSRFCVH